MAFNPDCEKTTTFKYVKILQRIIIILLLFIMSLILLFATINVILIIIKNMVEQPITLFTADNLMELFSIFLVILIGIELLETVKAFLQKEVIQVEIVVLVAIIAVARKVIIWDFSEYNSSEIFGLSAILIALAVTYFLIRRTRFKVNLHSKRAPIIKRVKGKLSKSETELQDNIDL